jgi:hypothetical protein
MAPPSVEREFAVEDIWTERPMGYHINPTVGPGRSPDVWDDAAKRRMIYEYCPEIKIILDMRLDREQCAVPNENPEGQTEFVDIMVESPPDTVSDPLAGSGPQGPREEDVISEPLAGGERRY